MAVKLRLRRLGRKKRPIYGLVAADSRSPRDGRFIEDLGRYSPISEPAEVKLERDRILYWLGQGAQPSDTVRSLLSSEGILLAHSLKNNGATDEEIATAVESHKAARIEKKAGSAKTTKQDRVVAALAAEKASAAQKAADYAKAKAESEAKAKAAADEAKAKAEAEVEAQRESAAKAAKEEQSERNEAQATEDASATAEAAPAEPEAKVEAAAEAEPAPEASTEETVVAEADKDAKAADKE